VTPPTVGKLKEGASDEIEMCWVTTCHTGKHGFTGLGLYPCQIEI
jgi:hypothetical protein